MTAEDTLRRARTLAADYVRARDDAHRALLDEDPDMVSLFTRAAEVEAELLGVLLEADPAADRWTMTQGGGVL